MMKFNKVEETKVVGEKGHAVLDKEKQGEKECVIFEKLYDNYDNSFLESIDIVIEKVTKVIYFCWLLFIS